jgi:two-component system, OmpR family, response regulator
MDLDLLLVSTGRTARARSHRADCQARDGAIDLPPREFRLFKYMMSRREQMLTRAMLLEEVWNYKFVPQTNLVDVHMGRLRRKVDEPPEQPMIHNVRGMGFILCAPA